MIAVPWSSPEESGPSAAFALLQTAAAVAGLHRTSEVLDLISTSESSGGPGTPTLTSRRMNPTELAAATPLASGVPTVRKFDAWTGGLQDGNANGAPCVRF